MTHYDEEMTRLKESILAMASHAESAVARAMRALIERDDALAVEAAEMMERHRVTGLLVVDASGRLVGAINSNDLMRAKVI